MSSRLGEVKLSRSFESMVISAGKSRRRGPSDVCLTPEMRKSLIFKGNGILAYVGVHVKGSYRASLRAGSAFSVRSK